jgi:hypothetical protein
LSGQTPKAVFADQRVALQRAREELLCVEHVALAALGDPLVGIVLERTV